MDGVSTVVPATPMIDLYSELKTPGKGHKARLEQAEAFVRRPGELSERFEASVASMAGYTPSTIEGFYTSRAVPKADEVKNPNSATVTALRIRDAGGLDPTSRTGGSLALDLPAGVREVGAPDLACEYLNRELVTTRTTGQPKPAEGAAKPPNQLTLDLLLQNRQDGTPIVAEVKRTSEPKSADDTSVRPTDKDPFFALVQALACISQLATPTQYARLGSYGRAGTAEGRDTPGAVELPVADPPVLDAYIVLHNPPRGTYIRDLMDVTNRLSVALLSEPAVRRNVRRIACLTVTVTGTRVATSVDFAYERC